jgi:hypothetical protein
MDKKEKDNIDKNIYIENKKNEIFNMNQHLREVREIIIKEKENLKVQNICRFFNYHFQYLGRKKFSHKTKGTFGTKPKTSLTF